VFIRKLLNWILSRDRLISLRQIAPHSLPEKTMVGQTDLPGLVSSLIRKDKPLAGIYFLETHPFLRQTVRSIYGCKTSQAG
jgi:hypothetical protein